MFAQGTLYGARTAGLPKMSSSGLTPLQAISAVTSGMDSIGNFMSYRGAASGYDLQAGLLDIEADSTTQSGIEQAGIVRSQGNRFIATQRALYAKAGVKFEGSPADVYRETERKISKDVLTTRLNAVKQANRTRFEATQNRLAAGQARTRSIQALGKGVLDIATAFATV